ncbi:LysR family transcriptional regulator [Vibrio sp. SCSIO 43140]|uniref:LysR family transcriptional regulator n=1 Tax=Vibrio sp. SCSIO 43140 TaxID=2819100 RepID=UPI002074D835|nr:LysR family transcriptional regulator [Vibrio sp. SCSIO 43140]USD63781.1 LysR family transcriptional regulator [Vibrio sp. SCSIO 43140]
MNFSLSQLQAFVATVELGSFKQAAISLNKRGQAIAQLVSTLEDSCQVQLFIRHTRRLELSVQGKKLYRYAKRVVNTVEVMNQTLIDVLHEIPDSFSVAIDNTLICDEIIEAYMAVLIEYPSIDLIVKTGGTNDVVDWVANGDVEMGLVFSPMRSLDGMLNVPIFSFPVVDVASPKFLNSGAVVQEEELEGYAQIVPEFVCGSSHESLYVISDKIIRTNDLQNAVGMLTHCQSWMRAPLYVVKPYLDNHQLNAFSIQGASQNIWFAELIYKSEETISVAGDLFTQKIQALDTLFQDKGN